MTRGLHERLGSAPGYRGNVGSSPRRLQTALFPNPVEILVVIQMNEPPLLHRGLRVVFSQ